MSIKLDRQLRQSADCAWVKTPSEGSMEGARVHHHHHHYHYHSLRTSLLRLHSYRNNQSLSTIPFVPSIYCCCHPSQSNVVSVSLDVFCCWLVELCKSGMLEWMETLSQHPSPASQQNSRPQHTWAVTGNLSSTSVQDHSYARGLVTQCATGWSLDVVPPPWSASK